jgi:hypothetical protein
VLVDWVRDMNRRGMDGDALLADARALIARHAKAGSGLPPATAGAPGK